MAGKNVKRFVELKKIEKVVEDDNGTIGTVIVKPNGVGWKPKNARKFLFVQWDAFEALLRTGEGVQEITQ